MTADRDRVTAERTEQTAVHHVEMFTEATFPHPHSWGWQCFDCGAEQEGFSTFSDAEKAAQAHEERAGK